MASEEKANKRPKFIVKGKSYLAEPTMDEFIKDADVSAAARAGTKKALIKAGIEVIEILYTMTQGQIIDIDGIGKGNAKKLFIHAARVKRKGDFISNFTELKKNEGNYSYLPTGSSSLDEMLNYTNGKVGWRSKTMIELYGPPSSGKTQICLTAAALCLRPVEKGGWGRGVAYIDSEGAFEGKRFEYLSRYWGVEPETLKDKFIYGRADSFDDLEKIIEEVYNQADEKDLGMIIIDSIIDPLKSQYIVGMENLQGLQPRQQHLKRVLDKIKTLATLKNAICIYTNHIMANIMDKYGEKELPHGGAVMGHASDIRIKLSKPTVKEHKFAADKEDLEAENLKLGRARIVDCGFLAEKTGYFLIGPFAIGDPAKSKELIKHSAKIIKDGYLSIDSEGNSLEPLDEDTHSRDEIIAEYKKQLYGTA